MSEAHRFDFGKFIPGFDFLQKLATSNTGAAAPAGGLHSWVAPTVSVDELDKRIKELKAVLFWLDQNATALKATIQALEVQKMTLSALAGMNLSMAEVAKAFTLPTTEAQPSAAAAPEVAPAAAPGWPFGPAPTAPADAPAEAAVPAPEPAPEAEAPAAPTASARKRAPRQATKSADAAPAAGLADPMQWWGALTQQFQQIAASALRDAAQAAVPEGVGVGAASAAADGTAAAPPARRPAAKKAAAKKKPSARAAKKAPAPGKKAAKKSAASAPAASQPAPAKSDAGWPLPPPFKFGR